MDASKFIEHAKDPNRWIMRGRALRADAILLWDAYLEDNAGPSLARKPRRGGYITSTNGSLLLFGLALELGLKARILKKYPEKVEIVLRADGRGEAREAELCSLGLRMGDGHDLEKLAEEAGVVQKDGDRERRETLRFDSECVRWSARYPVPRSSREQSRPFSGADSVDVGVLLDDLLGPVHGPMRVSR